MEKILKAIDALLVKYDVEGLMKMGCPADEYAHEAKMIVERLAPGMTVDHVETVVAAVFHEQFDTGTCITRNAVTGEYEETVVRESAPNRHLSAVAHEIHELLTP